MSTQQNVQQAQQSGAGSNGDAATRRVNHVRSRLRRLVSGNQGLLAEGDGQTYVGTGLVEFLIFIAWGDVNISLNVSGTSLTAKSSIGSGLGLGETESGGAATFVVDPSTLPGQSFTAQMTFAGVDAGGLVIDFYDAADGYIGAFVGAGVADGGALVSFSGTWS